MLQQSIKLSTNSKIPIYLQLKEGIKQYISSGNSQKDEQLPPLNLLAGKLGINFETVRKAYKELENEGFITMRRGRGSFFNLDLKGESIKSKSNKFDMTEEIKIILKKYIYQGATGEEIKKQLDRAFHEVATDLKYQTIIFTECNDLQMNLINNRLKDYFKCDVKPVLMTDLKDVLEKINPGTEVTVITTGFHYKEVKEIVGESPFNVEIIHTNLSKETKLKLNKCPSNSKFGFIFLDLEAVDLFTEILGVDLGICFSSCLFSDKAKVKEVIASSDVILVRPALLEQIKSLVPAGKTIISVLDSVNAMSMKILKEKIFSVSKTSNC